MKGCQNITQHPFTYMITNTFTFYLSLKLTLITGVAADRTKVYFLLFGNMFNTTAPKCNKNWRFKGKTIIIHLAINDLKNQLVFQYMLEFKCNSSCIDRK